MPSALFLPRDQSSAVWFSPKPPVSSHQLLMRQPLPMDWLLQGGHSHQPAATGTQNDPT